MRRGLQELFGRPVQFSAGGHLRGPHGMPALGWADLTEAQVGGQAGGDIAVRQVALISITGKAIGNEG